MHEGYGKDLKKFIRQKYGTTVGLSRPRRDDSERPDFMDIDPNVVDKWGIPVLRFHFKWSDHEIKMAKHMHDTFAAIFKEMGGELTGVRNDKHDNGISIGGAIIHEIGVARMGNDPKTSALNKYCQSHDVKNLFVSDGASVRQQSGQESHAHHLRPGMAHCRISCRGAA